MKLKLSSLVTILSSLVTLSLGAADEVQTKVEVGQGYRHDSLKWSVAGPHHKPNIVSELDYKDIQVYLSTLKASISNGTYIGVAEFAYGDILRGKNRDSDYHKDNRHGEYSRSYAKISGEYTVDAVAKIGRIIPFSSGITLTPSIGYGAFFQKIRCKNGYQDLLYGFKFHHHQSNLHHLNSTYKARWTAPFIELKMTAPLTSSLKLDVGYTFFYPIQYKGTGHWNLRHMHFTQTNCAAKSFGQKADIGLRWACTEHIELGLGCGLSKFDAKDGHVKVKIHDLHRRQPAHRATRTCIDYLATLSYMF